MSIEQWNVVAISRLLRFARKNDGPWDDLELWPKDDSRVMPNEDDAALIASAPQLQADRDRLRELLKESLRCLRDAKHQWAPSTTNSDADTTIARIAAALKEAEG